MSAETTIEWCDATWNPTRGCTHVSEGCRHCFAEGIAARFSGPGQPYEGLARRTLSGPQWTGQVRLVEDALIQPLRWKKPRRIFVDSMSDLFHEALPDADIDRVFAVMAAAERHTFQVLTKRPERMRVYLSGLAHGYDRLEAVARELGYPLRFQGIPLVPWPLPNIWLGVSVENQETVTERIPHLLTTPAAIRFLSVEPLLGLVDLEQWLVPVSEPYRPETLDDPAAWERFRHGPMRPLIDWVICGGESGPYARPCDTDWLRSVVIQCQAVGVRCFVKQLGSTPVWNGCGLLANHPPCPLVKDVVSGREMFRLRLRDRKGGEPSEWPEDLRVREYPEEAT